ncbi:MAG: hypothetical protein J6T10_24735 [Methanobrevibacter sp.]|nr:hypothetical protein [Methanobrevibacter sp.]
MSYELLKRLSLNEKKNKITLSTDSNNVYPKDYRAWEFCNSNKEQYKNYTFDDKLKALMSCILSGDLQVCALNDSTTKILYADNRMQKYMKLHNLDGYDMYCNREKYQKEYTDLFNIFKNSIFENDKGVYVLKVGNNDNYITCKGKWKRGYISGLYYGEGKERAMKFNRQLAELIKDQYTSHEISIELA